MLEVFNHPFSYQSFEGKRWGAEGERCDSFLPEWTNKALVKCGHPGALFNNSNNIQPAATAAVLLLCMLSCLFLITASYCIYKHMEIVLFLFSLSLLLFFNHLLWWSEKHSVSHWWIIVSSKCTRKLPWEMCPCRSSSLSALLWKAHCTILLLLSASHLQCSKRKCSSHTIPR